MISNIFKSRTLIHATRTCFQKQAFRSLSTFEKHHSVFKSLGIEKSNNKGVFDGEWKGSGEIVPSINPVNNEVMAEVLTVSSKFFSRFFPTLTTICMLGNTARLECCFG